MTVETTAGTPDRKPYDAPRLVQYGGIEDLTQGANHITTNITDILSIQSGV